MFGLIADGETDGMMSDGWNETQLESRAEDAKQVELELGIRKNLMNRPISSTSQRHGAKKRQRPQSAPLRRSKNQGGNDGRKSPNIERFEHGQVEDEDELKSTIKVSKAMKKLVSLPSSTSAIGVLRALRDAYEVFQSTERPFKALHCLERACKLKRELHGSKSKWTKASCIDFAKCCNVVATRMLKQGRYKECCHVLQRSLSINSGDNRALQATLVNLAACKAAERNFQEASAYLERCSSTAFQAEVELNRSVIHYKLGDADKAVFHAYHAVLHSQRQAKALLGKAKRSIKHPFEQREAMIVLALSYLALGKALALRQRDESMATEQGLKWLRKAYEDVAARFAGFPAPLARSLWLTYLNSCWQLFHRRRNCNHSYIGNEAKLAQTHVGAMRLQRVYRAFRMRSQMQMRDQAARSLQHGIRRYLAKVRTLYSTNCVVIQAWWRGTIVRSNWIRRKRAAVEIQARFRGSQPRKLLHIYLKACIRIQAWRRTRHARSVFQIARSAVQIQRICRGHLSRKMNLLRMRAIARIQGFCRYALAMRTVASLRRKRSAIKIQRFVRSRHARRHAEMCKRRWDASVTIQCWRRVRLARKAMESRREYFDSAYACVETFQRAIEKIALADAIYRWRLQCMRLARAEKRREETLARLEKELIEQQMQLEQRQKVIEDRERELEERLHENESSEFEDNKKRKNQWVKHKVLLQWMDKERLKLEHYFHIWKRHGEEHIRNLAATRIQRNWHRYVVTEDYHLLRLSIITIQRMVRHVLPQLRARNQRWEEIYLSLRVSFSIQALQRRWRERRKQVSASISIQARYRGFAMRNSICKAELHFDRSVVLIQTWFRMIMAKQISERLRDRKRDRIASDAQRFMKMHNGGIDLTMGKSSTTRESRTSISIPAIPSAGRTIKSSVIKTRK